MKIPDVLSDAPARDSPDGDEVRTAEVIASLCLATDLGMGLPFEHGLHSTLVAMRLAERLELDAETTSQTYYACLLFYAGCTADAEINADLFRDETALLTYFTPAMFGSQREAIVGIMRALAPPGRPAPVRAADVARRLPKAVGGHRRHLTAICEVARMLTERLGLPVALQVLWGHLTERWDGTGEPGRLKGDAIPVPLRIVHVARDATFQHMLGGDARAVQIIGERAGAAFDPTIAGLLADDPAEILALDPEASAWEEVLACEPFPRSTLGGAGIDGALAAMGDFADLISPYLVGHSSGVAELAAAAARASGFDDAGVTSIRRAGFVHDVGRVAVPARVWQKPGPLTPDEWERVRLHAYHSERVLVRSPALAKLAPVASAHHERCDGSGYHRGADAAALAPAARLLAAADAYHAMTEPRPHRDPFPFEQATDALVEEAHAGRLDSGAVEAVLKAAGQAVPRLERPAGLTEREVQAVALLARGLQTKQIARLLGISAKTADRHIQNAYGKIGVSTRAAAALFAMEHGLTVWGELPISVTAGRS